MVNQITELFTHATQELINQAAAIAQRLYNPVLMPVHLLAASFENEFCNSMFYALGIPMEQLHALVEGELHMLPQMTRRPNWY